MAKYILIFLASLLVTTASCKENADPVSADKTAKATPAKKAEKAPAKITGKVYGKGLAQMPLVSISELKANAELYAGKRVRVEGVVTDVCPKRGCWFNMAGDKVGTQIRFKVRDGVMVFPMSAKGKYAVAEGLVRKIPLSLQQTKRYLAHQAEEKGESFDPSTVTSAITLIRLDGIGAVLREKK